MEQKSNTKHGILWLALTLLCFFGIIVIFVVGGYLGVYDTIRFISGEREQKIDPDYWMHPEATYETGVMWGSKVFFTYQIDNRRFSDYSTTVNASVWRSQEKVLDLLNKQVTVSAFGQTQMEWVVDTAELVPSGLAQGQYVQYSIIVKRDNVERRIILSISPNAYPIPPKPVITIPPPG